MFNNAKQKNNKHSSNVFAQPPLPPPSAPPPAADDKNNPDTKQQTKNALHLQEKRFFTFFDATNKQRNRQTWSLHRLRRHKDVAKPTQRENSSARRFLFLFLSLSLCARVLFAGYL
jgi:hypothetical protein